MRSKTHASLLVAAVFAFATSASAAPVEYKLDTAHSEVGFRIRHFFSKVPGRFTDFTGTVQLDDKNLAASSVDVTIQTASINTANDRRDTHLKSPDFFAADSFPTLKFKSTKVTPGEGSKFKIMGDLTMRGITHPVTLDAEMLGSGSLGKMGTRAGFQASTVVNRKDWNILWNRVLDNGGTMLDDNVTIELGVEAVKVEPKTEETKPAADKK